MLFATRINNLATARPKLLRIWIKTGDPKTPLKAVWINESQLDRAMGAQRLERESDESAVDGCSAIEADQVTMVIDAVDDGRSYAIGVVDSLKAIGAGPDEAVGVAHGVHKVADHLSLVVQPKSLGEGATWRIQGG